MNEFSQAQFPLELNKVLQKKNLSKCWVSDKCLEKKICFLMCKLGKKAVRTWWDRKWAALKVVQASQWRYLLQPNKENGAKNVKKIWNILEWFGMNWIKMSQNWAKIKQKWSKNGAKTEQKLSLIKAKNEPKMSQKWAKTELKLTPK